MPFLIIAVIAVIVIYFVVKKSGGNSSSPAATINTTNPAELPDTLAELRQLRDKTRKDDVKFACRKKICDVGIQLYKEGKIVNDPSSEYDVSKLLGEMYELIHDCNTYTRFPADKELEYRCLDAGVEMSEKLNPPTPAEGGVFKFLDYAWQYLPEMYAEGKVCPRNAAKARKYFRMRIVYEVRMKDSYMKAVEGLMEVPEPSLDGKQEILKFIAMKYGVGAIHVKEGTAVRNFQAQTVQQAAELLFQMDWGNIGGDDIQAMLGEYGKGADAGNAYAQFKLGSFYLDGRYVAKDEAKGLALLEKAAQQDLYLAVDKISNHYYWLAQPYAGDYGNATKQQIQEWKAQSGKWMGRSERVLAQVERQYANSFGDYLNV